MFYHVNFTNICWAVNPLGLLRWLAYYESIAKPAWYGPANQMSLEA